MLQSCARALCTTGEVRDASDTAVDEGTVGGEEDWCTEDNRRTGDNETGKPWEPQLLHSPVR